MVMIASEAQLFQESAPLRGQFYQLFAQLFAQVPNLEAIELLADLSRQLADNAPVSDHVGQGLERLRQWREVVPHDQRLTAGASEHTRRFCLGASSVMPAASVFTSVERGLKKQIWEDLCDFYLQHGYELTEKTLLEDHLSTLFYFMATVCRDADAGESGYLVQQQFVKRFIQPWIEDFYACLNAPLDGVHGLYAAVGALLQGFMALEYQLLDLLPVPEQ